MADTKYTVTSGLNFLIPGLCQLNSTQLQTLLPHLPPCPCFSQLLAWSDVYNDDEVTEDQQLCALFGLEHKPGEDFPIAALEARMQLAQFDPASWYLKLTPVHMTADRDQLLLLSELELKREVSANLHQRLNQLYRDEPWCLCLGSCGSWYIQSSRTYQLQTSHPAQAQGARLLDYMPRGGDSAYWRSVLTEMQMFLHEHQVQDAEGVLVNSVWFSGSGSLPVLTQSIAMPCWGNSTLLAGLAQSVGISVGTIEAGMESLQSPNSSGVFALSSLPPVSDFSAWCLALEQLEEDIFSPLLQSIKTKKLPQAQIMTGSLRFVIRQPSFLNRWRSAGPWYDRLIDL